jgi:hypothetical protein
MKKLEIMPFKSSDFALCIWDSFSGLRDIVIQVLEKFPQDTLKVQLVQLAGRQRSVPDLIAYQIGWCSLLISWYEAGVRGEMPIMPGAGFTTWDYVGLADYFAQIYQYNSIDQQMHVLEGLVQRIVAIVEQETKSENIDKIGVWSWCALKSGKSWPLRKWVQVNTVAPFRRAAREMKKYLKHNK